MRRNEIRNLPDTTRRGGFTLIELIVVIAIIAALAALTAGATLKFLGSQQIANTKSTLDRTQSQLNKAWSKVKDQAYREQMPSAVNAWILANLAGNDANAQGRARVIYVKLKLRQAFPMNFNEALNPAPLPPLPAYTTYLTNQLGITGSTGANYESSACLLMALQRGVSGAGIEPSDLTKGGATGSAVTPNGSTLTFLTDASGTPLFFTRVPVGSPFLNPNPYPGGGQPGANDPLDPQGYLQLGNWATMVGPSGQFGTVFTALTQQQLASTNCSYNQAPMLCSAGLDKQLYTNSVTFSPLPAATPPPADGTYGDDLFSTP